MNGDSSAGTGADRSAADEDGPVDPESVTAPDRRRYLGLLGVAATSVAGCLDGLTNSSTTPTGTEDVDTETATPIPTPSLEERFGTHRNINFDRVLDAVDDLGLDPTGGAAVNSKLESALEEGTLVRFPEGEYQFDGEVVFDSDRVGLLGESDVRFVPSDGYTGRLFSYDPYPDDVLIENVDIDMRADETTTGIRLMCRNRFHIQDVEFLGRGLIDNSGQVSAFLLGIKNESGRGVLRNAVAKKGSRVDGYAGGNGRIGVWVGWSNKGTVRIEGCDFREFGNNGTYTSRTPGQVEIVDSYFLNNNASNVRIGGEGSYVENCTVEIDFEKYTGPPLGDLSTGFGMRGVQVEQGVQLEGAESIPAGAEIRNCELIAKNAPNGIAMVNLSPQGRSLFVEDTRIQVDVDKMWAIRRGRPGAVRWREWQDTPPKPHWLRMENVTIGGSAAGGAAVDLRLAPGSRVMNSDIVARGPGRDGVLLDHSPKSEILASNIRTDGHPVVVSVDPTTSPDRRLLCLDVETTLERFGDDSAASELTSDPPLFQTLTRNSQTGTVCLGLGPSVSTLPLVESITGPLRISIDALEEGIPIGQLLNGR